MSSFSEDTVSPSPPPNERSTHPKLKESLLKWWAIFPFAIFVVIVLIFGRPQANNPRANEAYTVGFVVGGCLLGLVLSLVSAWVTYHVTRKSQLGATLMFSLVILFIGLMMISNWARGRAERGSADPSPSQLANPARRH